jgi:hypothetical protein
MGCRPRGLNHIQQVRSVKNTKRKARGFRNFDNYRLRLLLNHGGIHKDQPISRIRTRAPRLAA